MRPDRTRLAVASVTPHGTSSRRKGREDSIEAEPASSSSSGAQATVTARVRAQPPARQGRGSGSDSPGHHAHKSPGDPEVPTASGVGGPGSAEAIVSVQRSTKIGRHWTGTEQGCWQQQGSGSGQDQGRGQDLVDESQSQNQNQGTHARGQLQVQIPQFDVGLFGQGEGQAYYPTRTNFTRISKTTTTNLTTSDTRASTITPPAGRHHLFLQHQHLRQHPHRGHHPDGASSQLRLAVSRACPTAGPARALVGVCWPLGLLQVSLPLGKPLASG
ncbi:hypothetical protein CEP51_008329 [Fusarium floridanum]|uniref:Uncharacterized protein n=1 Tax=Fusarium floridanum TaxID=1325733 RepID=A0A428RL76_9HYPO|nr:hypothetical protein CEP51_008329 [Fusarium floridanum]